jgi:hypothetical protein
MPAYNILGEIKQSIDHLLYRYMEKKEKIIIGNTGFNETYLVKYDDHQTIYVSQSTLRIFIYPVAASPDRKYDFYAYIEDNLTGFITENMVGFDEFYQALEWYSRHIDQPFFKLLMDNPVSLIRKD